MLNISIKMRALKVSGLLAAVFIALTLSGCSIVDGGPARPPVGLSDGVHSYRFVSKAPFLLDKNYLDVVTTYNGQWAGNRPKGQGEAVNNYGRRCVGEFGVDPDPAFYASGGRGYFMSPLDREYNVWAKGDVYVNGVLAYKGIFRNELTAGESCLLAGDGAKISNNGKIEGKFQTLIDSREVSGQILVDEYMYEGRCNISLKDGSSYAGYCLSPTGYPAKNGQIYLNKIDLSDPFVLASPNGIFTEPNGQRLSSEESKQKVVKIQRKLSNK